MITNIELLSLAIGVLLPLIVGLVTKDITNAGIKAVLLLALSAVTAFGTALYTALNGNLPFDWKAAAITALGAFVAGVGAHFGLWKPTTVSAIAQSLLVKTPVAKPDAPALVLPPDAIVVADQPSAAVTTVPAPTAPPATL